MASAVSLVVAVLGCIVSVVIYKQWESNPERKYNLDLLQSYTYNFQQALEERAQNMKKYSFPYNPAGVDRRTHLSLQEFQEVYDGVWPVIITDVVPTWPAYNWSISYFRENYADSNIVMSVANKSSLVVKLSWFLDNIQTVSQDSWLYLQDELFLLQHQELREQVPSTIYTSENFFDLFPVEVRPWDCYFLWGTAHSRSSLHIDPYNWTGTNAVISGLKKWKLIKPGQDLHLSIVQDRNCGFPLECKKYNSPLDLFTSSSEIDQLLDHIQFVEVDQRAGDLLIIPTGWFHQAYNVEPTLALSQQIMNAKNFKVVLEEIFKADNLPKSCLTQDVLMLSPEHLVKHVMSKLPEEILKKGAEETRKVLESIQIPPTQTSDVT
ncbi:uncharacterized protein LOC129922532 [Biomphalaria glabrata]|uniref:Uncharacterized protein LOC129922532 n=1 Tax=Biomphalaria glabrata TaxID=6526 RepID=A0A9W2YR50_BIOGL|nr:uncharacterized protein LOC129922532 [Biomphalaria glabrata]